MADVDHSYVNEILQSNSFKTQACFYAACQLDINAGYRREVDEAWRLRKAHLEAVKRRGCE